ncbi:LOW QUALITY PROTEIN: Ubiquitin homeostasis protein [Drechslerella dactyloides]|uniref:Ubiquitin homeostasis protein n=1 Tax=Drechslerella dactyloides TaxID=74499 RepID=A0AAD6IXT6_DREDA|nr:LOW QUALITY PROTEIN: Ubiquitin homeostasis protein [Drechslerella dactyloides]
MLVKGVVFADANTIISCSRDATVRIWKSSEEKSEGAAAAAAEAGGDAPAGDSDAMDTTADAPTTTAPEPTATETETETEAGAEAAPAAAPAVATVKQAVFTDTINSNAQGFVNCVAYMKPDADHSDGLIISAGQESLIDLRPPGYMGPDAAYLLVGHAGNVCSLDVNGQTIISGSWDKTAIVWKNWEKKFVLEGHTAAVWAVMAVSDTEFITGCADGKIRWYRGNKMYRSVQAHNQPVRGIHRLHDGEDGSFISCGNDGIIKSWDANGAQLETIYAHDAYIYSVTVLPNGQWASCGEDRTLRIWRKSQCLQTISHPCISVWCVAASENGDLVTGASDGVLRVWSREPERQADEETLKAYSEAVANTAIAEETTGGINKEALPGMSALGRPGKHDGEKIHINNDGNVEAYQWSARETTWEQVGVIASAVSSGRKVMHEGKEYDFVFDVDFEEGKPPIKLPYNASQDPWDAARIFLERNELPMTYLETVYWYCSIWKTQAANFEIQTANFIVQNTKGTRIGTSAPQQPTGNDPFGIESRYRPGDEFNTQAPEPLPPPKPPKLLPWKTYLDIASGNFDTASKKIVETNTKLLEAGDKEKSLNDEDLTHLKSLLGFLAKPSAPTSTSAKSSVAVTGGLALLIKIVKEWDGVQKLAALDLLRVLARHSPAVPLYSDDILAVLEQAGCFNPANTSHAVFGTRVLVNLFHYAEGLKYVTERSDEIIGKVLGAAQGSGNRLLNISVDTLLLNYSVYFAKAKDGEEQALKLLGQVAERVKASSDPEALYRAMMTLGNLLTTGKKAVSAAKETYEAKAVVGEAVKKVDSTKEKRTVEVGVEIELLLAGK